MTKRTERQALVPFQQYEIFGIFTIWGFSSQNGQDFPDVAASGFQHTLKPEKSVPMQTG
jgi:hypothetical protein